MQFNTNIIESQLDQVNSMVKSDSVQADLKSAMERFASLNIGLVSLVNEVNNGVKSLTSAKSDFTAADTSGRQALGLKNSTTRVQNIQHVIPDLLPPCAQITEGASSKLVPTLDSTNKSTLSAITGSSVTESFNNVAFSLATPQALAPTLSNMGVSLGVSIESSEIASLINSVVGNVDITLKLNLPSDLTQRLDGFTNNLNNTYVSDSLNKFTSGILKSTSDVLKTITGLPVLDALHSLNNSVSVVSGTFEFPVKK